MPIRRSRLTRVELAEHQRAAQELLRAGIIPNIPQELETSRALDIFIGPRQANTLWELPNGGTCCAIFARLLGLCGGLILEDFAIASDWWWLDLIPLSANEKSPYRLRQGFDFSWDEVLNHQFENGLAFHHRGDLAEGFLLAVGYKPIPDKYPDRMPVILNITFTDRFGESYPARAEAMLERRAHKNDLGSQPRKFPGLLEPQPPEKEVRPHQTIATTLKGPTKNVLTMPGHRRGS